PNDNRVQPGPLLSERSERFGGGGPSAARIAREHGPGGGIHTRSRSLAPVHRSRSALLAPAQSPPLVAPRSTRLRRPLPRTTSLACRASGGGAPATGRVPRTG